MAVELALEKSDVAGSQPSGWGSQRPTGLQPRRVRYKDVLSSLGLIFVPENSRSGSLAVGTRQS